jgi:hypothetical protein
METNSGERPSQHTPEGNGTTQGCTPEASSARNGTSHTNRPPEIGTVPGLQKPCEEQDKRQRPEEGDKERRAQRRRMEP